MAPKQPTKDLFNCLKCCRKFASQRRFIIHLMEHKKESQHHRCDFCTLSCKSAKKLEIHVNNRHRCLYCDFTADTLDLIIHQWNHMRGIIPRQDIDKAYQRGSGSKTLTPYPFTEIKAFKGYFRTYRYRSKPSSDSKILTVRDFFNRFKSKIRQLLTHGVVEGKHVKLQISLLCKFRRLHQDYEDDILMEKTSQYFNSSLKIILSPVYVNKAYRGIVNELDHFVEFFEKNGSGWVIEEIQGCDIRIAKFEILKGGCNTEVPHKLRNKGAIVNPKNVGSDCFAWAFLICMHGESVNNGHRGRTSQYKQYEHLYDFSTLNYPATLSDIKKFEKANKRVKVAINIFGWGKDNDSFCCSESLYIMLLSPHNNDPSYRVVNILYVNDELENHGHYMSILHFSRLINKHNCHYKHVCYNCLTTFEDEGKMKIHQELCFQFKAQKVEMPFRLDGSKPTCSFEQKHLSHKLKANYVIYADFEALLFKGEEDSSILDTHVPCGFCFVVVDYKLKIIHKLLYRGMDCMTKFMEELDRISKRLLGTNKFRRPMKPLTRAQVRSHRKAKKCHICELKITNPAEKVRDHDHNTGLYRGPAHHACNWLYTQKEKIPVVMHNFKNYDSQLLLSSATKFGDGHYKAIPYNSEKFISIICPTFYFVDSFMHMSASLDTLVKNLHTKPVPFEDKFGILCQHFGMPLSEKLARKGCYPYEYMDSWERFNETSFPDIGTFFNSLSGENISQVDYDYAKSIFDSECSNLGDYHDLYLMTDVLLLACVFENYRAVCMTNFKLDPSYYFSLPGYSWDSALFYTKIVLELITDPEMYNTIELGLRGGVSMITHRYAEAYNKYMEGYVKGTKEDSFLVYADKTNLYGEGMLQYLPLDKFEWESEDFVNSLTMQDILAWGPKDPIGRILVVDLEYSKDLHLLSEHNEYPLAPEKIPISISQLSSTQKDLLNTFNIKYSEKQKKLVPHLGNRSKYCVHYRNLIFYIQQGLRVTKIHKVIRFRQGPWLKKFVLLCSELRKLASDKFEKDLFKLVINSIFGRSMMNVRNKEDVYIVTSVAKAMYYTRKPNFKKFVILSPEVVIVFMDRILVELDKPIFTAFTILDVTKMFIYEWHYNKIKKWYGNRATFLFTDTDSLAYHIKTSDLYEDLKLVKQEFDFSEFPTDHPLYSVENKKRIGTMRDESNGTPLYSFVGVSPKMYSFAGENVHKVAMKGVKKSLVEKFVTHSTFMDVLFKQQKFMCSMNLIRSKNHSLTTTNYTKVAIHSFDSKRFILPDGISTLALNHYLIPMLNGEEESNA